MSECFGISFASYRNSVERIARFFNEDKRI